MLAIEPSSPRGPSGADFTQDGSSGGGGLIGGLFQSSVSACSTLTFLTFCLPELDVEALDAIFRRRERRSKLIKDIIKSLY